MGNPMIVINNVRYRREDAYRLGLISDGKVLTARSQNTGDQVPHGAEDALTEQVEVTDSGKSAEDLQGAAGDQGADRPARNASREEWVAYALASGVLESDLDGLKRDQISEMFPDDTTDEN